MSNQDQRLSSYRNTTNSVVVHYKGGKLNCVACVDQSKVVWDSAKYQIEFFEDELNKQKFKLIS